ncbi:MAG TPA: hypothetical protein PK184_19770, partial [Phycisphaerae bacterium]|nr:hypothetical protein [Phycisphaerae bacterium]HPU34937.1 hypothetical protein [Phycisphaerae bacterium]HQE45165.1 hypothetical protein [Phycisphaerae bacterium]
PFLATDFNQDCRVDADDLAMFEACSAGPAVPYPDASAGCTLTADPAGYIPADFDKDHDVDQDDFGIFQRCYASENLAADPTCQN